MGVLCHTYSVRVFPLYATHHIVITYLLRSQANLRTVPTIVTAQTFCASQDTRVSYGWCLRTIMWRKQNLASHLGIQKENWG